MVLSSKVMSGDVTLGSISGEVTAPVSFVSTNGELTVRFTSDYSIQYSGYEASFRVAGTKLVSKTFSLH